MILATRRVIHDRDYIRPAEIIQEKIHLDWLMKDSLSYYDESIY